MNPEEEERRRTAAEIARRMVERSAGADDADRFDAGSYADDRALEALASAEVPAAPGRPGEAAEAISDATPRQVGADRSHGVLLRGGSTQGSAPWPAEERERVASVERRLSSGDHAGVARDARADMAGTADVEDRALASLAQPAVTAASPAPMQQDAVGTGSDPGMAMRREGPSVDDRALEALASPARRFAAPASKPIAEHVPGEQIPGAADIDHARLEDGLRRPGRALAALFAGIGGRRLGPAVSREDQTRQRMRQMLGDKERMQGRDDAARRADSAEARQAQAAEAAQALATRTADRQDEALELQRQAAGRADATASAQAELTAERAATARSERERATARSTPHTDEARRAQTQLQALVNTLPSGSARDRLVEALVGPGMSIDQLSAEEVQEVMRRAPEWLRASLRRGGSGSGTPRAPRDRSSLIAAAEAAGIPRAVADATPDRQLAAMVEQRGRRTASTDEEGVELLPGVHGRASLVERGEGRATRDAFAHAMGNAGSLNRINAIAQEFGGVNAAISREAEAALTPELTMLRSMVAQMGGTGVINPSEVPAINAALPNPSELQQMTFGTFNRRLGAWRSIVEGNVRSRLSSRGVQGEDLERAMRALWSGEFEMPAERGPEGTAPSSPPAAGAVRVRLPDGRVGRVPQASVERLVAAGAEVLQ